VRQRWLSRHYYIISNGFVTLDTVAERSLIPT